MKRGRPRYEDAHRCYPTSVWLKPAHRAKLRLLGGSRWMREAIEAATPKP